MRGLARSFLSLAVVLIACSSSNEPKVTEDGSVSTGGSGGASGEGGTIGSAGSGGSGGTVARVTCAELAELNSWSGFTCGFDRMGLCGADAIKTTDCDACCRDESASMGGAGATSGASGASGASGGTGAMAGASAAGGAGLDGGVGGGTNVDAGADGASGASGASGTAGVGGSAGAAGLDGGPAGCVLGNLVRNPGFESNAGTDPSDWTLELQFGGNGFSGVTNSASFSGLQSLLIDSSSESFSNWTRRYASAAIPAFPDRGYTLTGHAFGDAIRSGEPPLVFLRTLDSSQLQLAQLQAAAVSAGAGFEPFGPFSHTTASNVAFVQIVIEVSEGTRVYFDDICLVADP